MDIKTFKTLAPKLPSNISVLMRGPTGIGKSQLAFACAKELGMKFIDVSGATMDESKVTGIPDFEVSKQQGVATFVLPSWFVRACREPVVLMLDELNRSMPQVQQAFFQIVLDRSLGNDANGNPMVLHPETRVFAAVNHGAEYDVNDMYPALLRRFWTVDLESTSEDWLSWAADRIDPVMLDFIRQNPVHLRVDPSKVEAGTVCPNPASWHRLNDSLVHMGWAPQTICGTKVEGFYSVCLGFVGVEASIAFTDFVVKYDAQISAEDVINGKLKDAQIKKLKSSEISAVIEKLVQHAIDNKWSVKTAKAACDFIVKLPGENVIHFWSKVIEDCPVETLNKIQNEIGTKCVEIIRSARAVATPAK